MNKVLVLTDFSEKAEHAAALALKIAEKTNSEILLYNSFYAPEATPDLKESYPHPEDFNIEAKENDQKMETFVQRLKQRAGQESKPKIHYVVERDPIGGKYRHLGPMGQFSLIVMGDEGREENLFDKFFLGSDALKIITMARCPVLLIPEKARLHHISTIALACKLDRSDFKAIASLTEFARCFDAKILIVHVCPSKLSIKEKVKSVDWVNSMKERVKYEDIFYEDIIGKDVHSALQKFIHTRKPDILALVHRNQSFFENLYSQSTVQLMLKDHDLPLMIFH